MFARRAFTLVELLVVVSIIVVLLALLTPALDKAITQAEMAVCGARLKSLGTAATTYAAANSRKYPYRGVIKQNSGQPSRLITSWPAGFFDDRFMLRDYMGTDNYLCPLSPAYDIEATHPESSDNIFSSYSIWFGFRYAGTTSKSMDRIGQKFTWQPTMDGSDLYQFSLLASDLDHVRRDAGLTFTSHPDKEGILVSVLRQGVPYYVVSGAGQQFSGWWEDANARRRGKTDLQYVYEDGSVLRLKDVEWNEWEKRDRLVRVPEHSGLTTEQPDWHQLPRP